jgi:PAS domain S-box-containing protein
VIHATLGFVLAAACLLAAPSVDAAPPTPVRIQLKWLHQFQFAGYYAADAKGYYEDEGLAVTIVEGGPDRPPIPTVLAGGAHFGVSDAEVLLARMQGHPLVACAAIFQHSPYVILSRKDRGIRTPADLVGKRVMLADNQGAAQMKAMLTREGIAPDLVHLVEHSWNLADLIEGRVDAISAYSMVEPRTLLDRGVDPWMLAVSDYGVDFYGDTLFTTRDYAVEHPDRVEAFVRASRRGWEYALDHPDEVVDWIVRMPGIAQRGLTRELLLAQAEGMRPNILPDVVEIGHMNPGRWRHIAEIFADLGMAPAGGPPDDFLFQPAPEHLGQLRRTMLLLGGASLALAVLIILWSWQIRRLVRRRTRELSDEVTRRRQSETELKEALAEAQRLRLALDHVPSHVFIKDRQSRYRYANRASLELFGVSAAELPGSEDANILSPETARRLRAIDERVLAGEQTSEEVEVLLPGGGRRVYLEVKTPLREEGAGQEISGLLGISTDITERKEREERLHRSEQRFQRMFQLTPVPLLIVSAEGRITYVNEAFTQVFGYTLEDVPDLDSWWARTHPDIEARRQAKQAWNGLVDEARAHHAALEPREFDRVACSDGSVRSVEISGAHLDDELVVTFFDLTERREAEARLELQSAALNAAANGIVITDHLGHIVWINHAFTKLTGYTEREVFGRTPSILKSGKQSREFYEDLWRTIRGGHFWRGGLRNRRKDGTLYDEEMTITPLHSTGGEITHFIAIKQDVTERKALEKQYLRAQRIEGIGLLASGIAHDLNNVLTPVLMGIDLMKLVGLTPELRTIADNIEVSARRGAAVIKQVLTFARGVDGEKTRVELGDLIEETVRLARETFPRNIRVESRLPADLWSVQGDNTQLHQVLLNLSVNARDAMPAGGELAFSATNVHLDEEAARVLPQIRPGDFVRLEIRDSGVGMAPEVVDHIFEPFFTTKGHGEGTGLGLSTVLGIVRGHGGAVTVESAPEQGTCFVLHLPALLGRAEIADPVPIATFPRGNGELLLVVDDEHTVLSVLERLLERSGYRTVHAENGVDALRVFSEHADEIALVITDIMMPRMDGVALICELLRLRPGLPCIAASGLMTLQDQIRIGELRAYGVTSFLSKPFSAEALLEMVRKELG